MIITAAEEEMMTNSMKSETFVQGGIWWCPQRNEAVTLWWRSVICGIFSGIGARTCCFFSQRTGSVNKMSPERLKLPELTCIAADDPAATDARIWSCSAPLKALNPTSPQYNPFGKLHQQSLSRQGCFWTCSASGSWLFFPSGCF